MQTFRVIVAAQGKAPQILHVHSDSLEEAQSRAEALGGTLLRPTASPHRGLSLNAPLKQTQKIDEIVFCTQLKSLLNAGLTLQESIEALQTNPSSKASAELLRIIKEQLAKGMSFSAALANAASSVSGLSSLLISMTKAAEQTSELPQTLSRYTAYAQQVGVLRQKIRAALVYPAFLLGVGALVILFLLFFVVPRFAGIYDSVRVDLPFAAKLLLVWGQWVKAHGAAVLLGFASLGAATVLLISRPKIKEAVIERLLRLAKLQRLVTSIQLARFYRTLAMLLAGGVALKPALKQLASGANIEFSRSIHRVLTGIEQGQSLTAALDAQNLFISVAKSLISAGEASGNLAAMLTEAAEFIETESFNKVDKWMRLLEPALMTVLGLVIGLIVVLMYMPIFELAGSLH